MMRKICFILLTFCLCATFTSCIGRQAKVKNITNYYTLEYELPEAEARPIIPFTLQLQRFQISPDYNTEKIVFRKNEFLRNNYNYERWRSSPRDLVTYFLSRDMLQSGLFQGVFPPDSLQRSTHLVTGTIDEFYEKDGEPWYAVLGISVVFLKANEPDITKRIIFQKSYKTEVLCKEKTVQSFVLSMGKAMALVSKDIINDIYNHLPEK